MRTIVLAAFVAMGIGLIGMSDSIGAPANGNVIGAAAQTTSPVTKVVVCAMRRVCGRHGCAMRRVCR
jgi:hypothetical protein